MWQQRHSCSDQCATCQFVLLRFDVERRSDHRSLQQTDRNIRSGEHRDSGEDRIFPWANENSLTTVISQINVIVSTDEETVGTRINDRVISKCRRTFVPPGIRIEMSPRIEVYEERKEELRMIFNSLTRCVSLFPQ